jgi:maltose-binding protein MalE
MVCAIRGAFVAVVAHAQNVDWKTELKKADGKTLRIIMIQDPWVKAFDTINKEFTDLTGAQVIIDSYSYDDVHQKEVLMGNDKSDSYDIVVLDSPWVGEFQQTGYVEDLKPYIEKDAKIIQWDDFVPSFREVAGLERVHLLGFRLEPTLFSSITGPTCSRRPA